MHRLRITPIHITADRLRLIENETVMLQNGNASERMKTEIWLLLRRSGRERNELIWNSLLFKRNERGTPITTANDRVSDYIRHNTPPVR